MRHVVKGFNAPTAEVENRVNEMIEKFNESRSNEKGHYSINVGAKGALFTLWKTHFWDGGVTYRFIRTLGKDYESSVKKAMELTANSTLELWIEEDSNVEYSYDKDVFCFGKYKGQKIEDVAQENINYLIFLKGKRYEFDHMSKTMEGNFDNIEAQVEFYFDTLAQKNRETCKSEYLGAKGDKVLNIELTVDKVLIKEVEDYNPYGSGYTYCEEIICNDASGNRVRLRFNCGTANWSVDYIDGKKQSTRKAGDVLKIKSAKVSATFESLGRKTTALNYVRMA